MEENWLKSGCSSTWHYFFFLQNILLEIIDHLWLVTPQYSLTHYHQFLVQKKSHIPFSHPPLQIFYLFLIFPSCTYTPLNSFIFARTAQLCLYNCVLCPRFFLLYSLITAVSQGYCSVTEVITKKMANLWYYFICLIRHIPYSYFCFQVHVPCCESWNICSSFYNKQAFSHTHMYNETFFIMRTDRQSKYRNNYC